MKRLFFLPLIFCGCTATDLANFSAGYADGVAAYQAPVPYYCPPPPPIYYTPYPRSSFTPGVTNALHPFTYFNP